MDPPTYMHPHSKLLHTLCSWFGYRPGNQLVPLYKQPRNNNCSSESIQSDAFVLLITLKYIKLFTIPTQKIHITLCHNEGINSLWYVHNVQRSKMKIWLNRNTTTMMKLTDTQKNINQNHAHTTGMHLKCIWKETMKDSLDLYLGYTVWQFS